MDFFKKNADLIIPILIFIVMIIVITGVFIFLNKNIFCPNKAAELSLEYKYNFLAGGCFVKYKEQWVETGQFRVGKLD